MRDVVSTKNVCMIIGVIFGILMYYCSVFVIPSSILLIIGGIQMFEISKKRKKLFEEHINFKLKSYEDEHATIKKDYEKMKSDLESFKNKVNITQAYGHKI